MNVSIGKYNIGTEERFQNEAEAIKFVKLQFPELSVEEIRPYVKPLINKDANKSGNLTEEDSKGKEADSKTSGGRVESKKAGKD